MNWYMIKTKDTYVIKLCILFHIFDLFNFFNSCEVRSGVGLWLVNTYQYGCHPSVLSHRALGTAECDESNEGGPYLVVGVRGILLPWVILRREGRHDHIWISNFSCDVGSRGGVMPLYRKWMCLWPYMGTPQRRAFLGGLKCVWLYYYYLCNQYISLLKWWVRIPLRWGVLDTTLCDCQWLAASRWLYLSIKLTTTI